MLIVGYRRDSIAVSAGGGGGVGGFHGARTGRIWDSDGDLG